MPRVLADRRAEDDDAGPDAQEITSAASIGNNSNTNLFFIDDLP